MMSIGACFAKYIYIYIDIWNEMKLNELDSFQSNERYFTWLFP